MTTRSDGDPGPRRLDEIIADEIDRIRRRRHPKQDANTVKRSLVGLALSGGGIRSATTNLGVLQALSRMDMLPMVDYVSTVSGGGYIGGCLTSLLSWNGRSVRGGGGSRDAFEFKPGDRPPYSTAWPAFPFRTEYLAGHDTPGTAQVAHLRTHGNFLINRLGLFRRETLRGIGAVTLGTMFNLGYFLLTVFAAAAIYVAILLAVAPKIPSVLRAPKIAVEPTRARLGAGVMTGDSAQRRTVVTPCNPDTPGCTIERTTTLEPLTLAERVRRNIRIASQGLRPEHVRFQLRNAAIGGALFSTIALVALLLAVRRRISRSAFLEPGVDPGDSTEDRAERRLLQGVAMFGTAVVIGGTVGLYGLHGVRDWRAHEQLGWLWTAFAWTAAMWATAFLGNAILQTFTTGTRRRRSVWHAFHAMTGYATITMALVAMAPLLVYALVDHDMALAAGAVGSGLIARLLVPRLTAANGRRFSIPPKLRNLLLGIAIWLMVGLLFLLAAVAIAKANPTGIERAWFLLPVALFVVLGFFVDQNRLSPHYFYRDRLAETYLFTERADRNGRLHLMRDAMEMPLHLLDDAPDPPRGTHAPGGGAPYHLISAAINLGGSRSLTRKDRKSGYWLFSKLYTGSTHTGFRPTAEYRAGTVTLAGAMAISGAAASSAAGFQTFFAQAFAAVLFNVRLGTWLENPRSPHSVGTGRFGLGRRKVGRPAWFWPWWLGKEMLMWTTEHDALVNLSDGGHTGDNLGIYPLLERRCKVIIACDAECDPSLSFGSFTEALRHAYVDMGIAVDIDLTMIRPDPATGISRNHCAVGRILYPDRPKQASYLIYLKNSLTGDEPEPILNYRGRNATFPHETTADQFFTDDQFESYRALGVHIAEDAFAEWIATDDFRRAFEHHAGAWHA